MPSQYLKCETCPAVFDRRPNHETGFFGQPTYRWSEYSDLVRDAKAAGWLFKEEPDPAPLRSISMQHYCPSCAV